jgi:4-amino-4-deoxy-L-arabinose transferase-like glycosyltransferase
VREALRRWSWLLIPLSAGALLRSFVALLPTHPAWDGVIYARAAEQLASGEGYTLRILRESAPPLPTAFYPVGYPAFLAALRHLGLEGWSVSLAQALIASLTVVWAALLARRLGGMQAGRIAAWLAALHPGSILLGGAYLAEPVFASFAGGVLVLLAYAPRRRRVGVLVVALLLFGALALMRPVSAIIALLIALGLGWQRARWRGAFVHGALAILLVGLALLPWAIRNERALGSPVPISTNAGFNLLLGTIELGAYGPLPEALDCHDVDGEADKDRCRRDRAVSRMIASPLENAGRVILKLGNTFGHESSPARYLSASLSLEGSSARALQWGGTAIATIYLWGLLVLAALALRRASPARAWVLVLAPILATALVHGLVLGGDRYHLAVMPCLFALAARGARLTR